MKTKIIVGLLILVAIVWLGVTFPRGNPVINVGAQSGTDDSNPFHSIGGVNQWYYSTKLNNASTTLCNFVAPPATSTLFFASITIGTATATPIIIEMGTPGNAKVSEATTTLLAGSLTLPTNVKGTLFATTSANFVFGPSQRLVIKFGANAAITQTVNSLKGSCKAIFVEN